MATETGNFFPLEFKSFPFREGDLLASQGRDGRFLVSKVLKIDRVNVKAGGAISIQGQTFVAPEDDFLLVVSVAIGEREFASLQEAKTAAEAGTWHVRVGHIPARPLGVAQGQVLVGHADVAENELDGYRQWRAAFDRGEAGIF